MKEQHKASILGFYNKNGRMPNITEIMKLCGLQSRSAAFYVVGKLISEGIAKKDASGKLIPLHTNEGIKMLGLVEAGFPTPSEENLLDTVTLDSYMIDNREASFMLRVKGDSMIDAGIHDGDFVIVERTTEAKPGNIVIAEIDGAWTMKYLRKEGKNMYLEAANKSFKTLHPKHSFSITAVVKGVVRKYG